MIKTTSIKSYAMLKTQGPFINLACFCEMALIDQNDLLSLIRVIESITHFNVDSNQKELEPFYYDLKLVLSMTGGSIRGLHKVKIQHKPPDATLDDLLAIEVQFDSEDKYVNVIANLRTHFSAEGIHWFNILLDDDLIARISLKIVLGQVQS